LLDSDIVEKETGRLKNREKNFGEEDEENGYNRFWRQKHKLRFALLNRP
jgi:hypothetical protein